jgi:tryptophan-rich sensory protein
MTQPSNRFPQPNSNMSDSRQNSRSLLMLAGFGLVTAGAAWYGARYSRRGSREAWYRELEKPAFTVPEKMIPAVWTALYALIAWSGWRVWSAAPSRQRSAALRLWLSQLLANAKWSKLFFGDHRPDLSLADSIALEESILLYISKARRVDRDAAYAFIPYAAWVAYATVLNAEIVRLNPRRELSRPA